MTCSLVVDELVDDHARYGASIRCQQQGCERTFHYPCAVTAGHLDIERMRFFCSMHDKNEVQCDKCKVID